MVPENSPAGVYRDIVPRLHSYHGIDFQVGVYHDEVAHFSRTQIVHADDAWRVPQSPEYRSCFSGVGRPVHQIMQRSPSKAPPHLCHKKPHDECRDRIENRISGEVTNDADSDYQR